MSLLKIIKLYLFGPDAEMLAAPVEPPKQILSDEQIDNLRGQIRSRNAY